jgi:hypothetical protein
MRSVAYPPVLLRTETAQRPSKEGAPVLTVGDGALGFWSAIREVFPEDKEQRCWVHYADLRIMPTIALIRTQMALKMSA